MGEEEEKVVKINEEMQHNIPELLEHVRTMAAGGQVERMVVFWVEKDLSGVSFSCGSKDRDYKLEAVNWDLDQLKLGIVQETYLSTD